MIAYKNGYQRHSNSFDPVFINGTIIARKFFRDRLERYVYRLTEEVIASLKRNSSFNFSVESILSKVRAVFDSYEYRTRFIEDVEIKKAFSYGEVNGLKDAGIEIAFISSVDGSCAQGAALKDKEIILNLVTLEDIPPFHAKCSYHISKNFKKEGKTE